MSNQSEDATRDIASLIHQIHNNLKTHLLPDLNDAKLSFYEMETLDTLTDESRKWTITRLANHVGITQPGMSTLLRSLEAKKLVKIKSSPDDRRQRIISATKKGLDLCNEVQEARTKAYEMFFDGITDQQIERTMDVLDRLNENVSGSLRRSRRWSGDRR